MSLAHFHQFVLGVIPAMRSWAQSILPTAEAARQCARVAFAIVVPSVMLSAFAGPNPSSAATISPSVREGCAIELVGEIAPGDNSELVEIARELGLDTAQDPEGQPNSVNDALCLNSNGGSYLEGRILSETVHEMGLTTRVLNGSNCFSACAFVFMSGRAYGIERDGVSRFMHASSNLGFHAPYLDLENEESFTAEQVEDTAQEINLIISDMIRFGSAYSVFDTRSWFPISLVVELLKTGRNELVFVDTIEKANRWRISLEGVRPPHEFSKKDYAQACVNFQNWMLDRPSRQVASSAADLIEKVEISTTAGEREFWYYNNLGYVHEFCLMTAPSPTSGWMSLCSYSEFNGLIFGDCVGGISFSMPWYSALPPATSLRALAVR